MKQAKHMLKHNVILLLTLYNQSSLWVAVVLALLITFRDKKILKTAGLAAQFIIHGNDIGFSKSLCKYLVGLV